MIVDASLDRKPGFGVSTIVAVDSVRALARWLAAAWSLTKPGISVFIGLTAATGALLADNASPGAHLWLFAAGFLSSGGSAAFNQYYERDLDARMSRTAGRALPAGLLGPAAALSVAGVLLAGGVLLALFAVGFLPAIFLLAGAFVYVVLYTVVSKRRTVWNVPVGGFCGALAALAGCSSGAGISVEGLAFSFLLYAWSAPHFWALAIPRANEYAAVGVPMLPVRVGNLKTAYAILAHAVLLPLPALLVWGTYPVAAAAAALTGFVFVGLAWSLVRMAGRQPAGDSTRRAAMRVFFFSLAHLPIVYLGFWVHASF